MALDVSKNGAIRRHLELQQRLWEARHSSMQPDTRRATAKQMWREIRTYLIKASNARLLDGGEESVHSKLEFFQRNDRTFAIAVGNRRNFRRDMALPHFRRARDGAWFDFQLQLTERASGIEILAYDFELRLADETLPGDRISFVRFDLNPPGHGNDDLGLRSHMHVSSDDDGMSVPAPVMSPFQLLDLMVHGLVKTGRIRRLEAELSGQNAAM